MPLCTPLLLACVSLLLLPNTVQAQPDHIHVFPERNDDVAIRAASWSKISNWHIAPPARPDEGGTRVAAIFAVHDDDDVVLEARGLRNSSAGTCDGQASSWTAMEQTFAAEETRIAVLDLGDHYDCAQLRMRTEHSAVVGDLQWELLVPAFPKAGAHSRKLAARAESTAALAPELQQIGVISRAEWGARPSGCSATESDWYRMAIHHTAGPQTSEGSVRARVQATQAYAMDSGSFCDMPYQMLVGYDGSLWEGRELTLRSGATRNNNTGNLAVSFIGCYHEPESQCTGGVGHAVTDEMMRRGQLLVQTLARLHDISTAEDNIRGHRDWPTNQTSCPGSKLHPRLAELRADLAWLAAEETQRSWTGEVLELVGDTPQELWIELENTGGLAWEPGETFLAPTPREQTSPLHHDSWPTPNRAATVTTTVAPGEIGRFVFTIQTPVPEVGEVMQTFGLVHDSVGWFGDAPWGGGPSDQDITVRVAASASQPGGSTGAKFEEVGFATTGGESFPPANALPYPYGQDRASGGCAVGSRPPRETFVLVGLLGLVLALCRRARPFATHDPS